MKATLALFFIILAIIVMGIGPVLTIWSLNALFGLNIVLGFGTWFSVVWLQFIAAVAVNSGIHLSKT